MRASQEILSGQLIQGEYRETAGVHKTLRGWFVECVPPLALVDVVIVKDIT